MEWFLAKLTQSFGFVQRLADWADHNVLAAMFFGYLFINIVGYIVKITPNKYDDLCFDIVVDAVKGAWDKIQGIKGMKGKKLLLILLILPLFGACAKTVPYQYDFHLIAPVGGEKVMVATADRQKLEFMTRDGALKYIKDNMPCFNKTNIEEPRLLCRDIEAGDLGDIGEEQ